MSFAVCLEAATVGLIVMEAESSNPSKADSSACSSTVASEDGIFQDLNNSPSNSNNIGSDVLDSLQVVVEKIKGHFDQKYRAKGVNYSRDIFLPFASLHVNQYVGLTFAGISHVNLNYVSSLSSFLIFPNSI